MGESSVVYVEKRVRDPFTLQVAIVPNSNGYFCWFCAKAAYLIFATPMRNGGMDKLHLCGDDACTNKAAESKGFKWCEQCGRLACTRPSCSETRKRDAPRNR